MGAGAGTSTGGMAGVTLRGKQAQQKGLDPLKLLDQRERLQAKERDEAGTVTSRALARKQLQTLDAQITAAVTPQKPAPVPLPKPGDTPVTPAPAPVPLPVPAAAPTPAPDTAADEAEKLKLAEEQRQRELEAARTAELARRDAQRKKRGTGLESFLTTGLRGLPTSLAQILGV